MTNVNNIQRDLIRLSAGFSTETLQARREQHNIFKVMKGKNLSSRILYSARLLFRFDGEIKSFPDKQKLREISTTKQVLQQILKELYAGHTRKGKDQQKIHLKQLTNQQQDQVYQAKDIDLLCMYALPLTTSLCLTSKIVSDYFILLDNHVPIMTHNCNQLLFFIWLLIVKTDKHNLLL